MSTSKRKSKATLKASNNEHQKKQIKALVKKQVVKKQVVKKQVVKKQVVKKQAKGQKKETFKLTSDQPSILYSRDIGSGLETVKTSQTFTSPENNSITFVSTKESVIPSHEITTPSGITSLSGSEKRAMVVQYYTNMAPTKFKKYRKHHAKIVSRKKHISKKNT